MKRREFITLVGSAAAAWPLAAHAQQPALPVIGVLASESAELCAGRARAFRQGLSETGFVEGRNVAIEPRWANGRLDQLPALASELVRRQAAAIAVFGGPLSGLAAKAATTTIPIIFTQGADPVAVGLVASLNQPGGNVTGVVTLNAQLGPKRLELLHESVPTATSIAVLLRADTSLGETQAIELQAAASALGLKFHVLRAGSDRDFDAVFATLVQLRAGGLVITADALFNTRVEQLAALALQHAIPTIFLFREFAAAGGLMSYGGSLTDAYRLSGAYTGRILKGEKPADLPVQQATKVELVINLKTAKALGLTVPTTLLGRADEVIE
jgi:putative tryptophan/tyrosine transport system substrate-binding protein